jgi:transcriptional regulator with XRE-family HTH domain
MNTIDLRQMRISIGRTQADVAAALGLTQSQVSRHEEDPENVPMGLMRKWLAFLGTSLQEIDKEQPIGSPPGIELGTPYTSLHDRLRLLDDYARTGEEGAIHAAAQDFGGPTLADLRGLAGLLRRKPNLVLTGRFDSGKSRLANALLGGEHLPSAYAPLTRLPTYVRHASDRPAWLDEKERVLIFREGFNPLQWDNEEHCRGQILTVGGMELLKSYGTHRGEHKDIADAHSALVYLDSPLLQACNVIDLPGFNNNPGDEKRDEDRRKAEAAFSHIDLLIYVAPCQGFLDGTDFSYLSHLLRGLPPLEKEVEAMPQLGNLFIVASHAHPGIRDTDLNEDILNGGAERLWKHFRSTILSDRAGRPVGLEAVRARFFSFWAETEARRVGLERAVRLALAEHVPMARTRAAEAQVLAFKERARGNVRAQITAYERVLADIEQARRELEDLERNDPIRRKRLATARDDVRQKVAQYTHENVEAVKAIYTQRADVDALEKLIEAEFGTRANPKEEAKKYAAALILERIQHEGGEVTRSFSEALARDIEKFLGQYDSTVKQAKLTGDRPLEIPFDSRGAFFGGIAGMSFVGAMTAWAASLGNLGAYIIAAKAVGLLASLGISIPGGSAAVMAALSAIGGPVTVVAGVAVALGMAIWRLFGDSWQRRLAKRIREDFEAKGVLDSLLRQVRSYWEATMQAFESGATAAEKAYGEQFDRMRKILSEPGKTRSDVETRLKQLEILRDFFGGIPWFSA